MSTPPARDVITELSWWMSKPGGRSTCCLTGKRPASQPGWRSGRGSRWSVGTGLRSSPGVPPSARRRQSRSPTCGTCGTTSVRPPSEASPSTAACAPAAAQVEADPAPAAEPATLPWTTSSRFADRTRSRHATIHALIEAGHSRCSIQRQLGMTRSSVLDGYKSYLDDRCGKRSCPSAARGATGASAPTRTGNGHLHGRWRPVHHRLARSPDGSSAAPGPSPSPNSSSSRPSRPTAPRSPPSPATSGPARPC